MKKYHLYHLVNPSPWPFITAFAVFSIVVSFVGCIHNYLGCFETFLYALANVSAVAGLWWRDVTREATLGGHHTGSVQRGLRLGFALFLVSEGMLFFSFFWAFFYLATIPAVEVGGVWPPVGVQTISSGGVPLLNTYLLVWSGVALTWSHFALLTNHVQSTLVALLFTLGLGLAFLGFQASEYYEAPFDISDGVYGSTFYLLTGFHGLHVLIGWVFLFTSFFRIQGGHFTQERHLGYEMAIWYWHFVDVIWLGLYLAVYCWGGAA